MDQAVLVPILTVAISIGSFAYTTWRSSRNDLRLEQVDARTAAKDTVEVLSMLNEAMSREINSLHERLNVLEAQHKSCEDKLLALTEIHQALLEQHAALGGTESAGGTI